MDHKGDVYSPFYEVQRAAGRSDLDPHLRIVGEVLRQEMSEHRLCHGDRAANPDQSARRFLDLHDRRLSRLRFRDGPLAMLQEELSSRGDRECSGRTLHESCAETFLKVRYSPAQSGLRNTKTAAGRRKAAVTHDLRKKKEIVEIRGYLWNGSELFSHLDPHWDSQVRSIRAKPSLAQDTSMPGQPRNLGSVASFGLRIPLRRSPQLTKLPSAWIHKNLLCPNEGLLSWELRVTTADLP